MLELNMMSDNLQMNIKNFNQSIESYLQNKIKIKYYLINYKIHYKMGKFNNESGDRGGDRGGGRGRGSRGGPPRGGPKVFIQPHRLPGVYIARGPQDTMVTKNIVPGESVYN